MVATVSPPIKPPNGKTDGKRTVDDVAASQERRLRELEERVERQAIRRDSATLIMFALSAFALLAGVFSIGLGMRAITESKRNVAASAPAVAVPAIVGPPHATLTEFKVALSATTFAPGPLTVAISNGGTVPHELLVFRSNLDASAYPVDAAGNILEEDATVTKVSDGDNIDPGGSQTRTIDLTAPGKYVFVCNLPGHFKAGMFTQVTVG